MEEKLKVLYETCIQELKTISIPIDKVQEIGEIHIKLAKRNAKRYGCCKQSEPDKRYYHWVKRNHKKIKVYDKFWRHDIEISKWVMELDEKIIKNTILHELIHCLPNCNNHGKKFKELAEYINQNLGYQIQRLGNKEKDYQESNVPYPKQEDEKNKYKIKCKDCGFIYYRQRLRKNFLRDYRCGKCKGKLELIEEKPYYTYMLRCQDNSIYTGITTDVKRRMEEHFGKTSLCAKYTLHHTPKKLEAVWKSDNRVLASKLEFHIKKLNKKQKEEILLKNNLSKFLQEKIQEQNYVRIKEINNIGKQFDF